MITEIRIFNRPEMEAFEENPESFPYAGRKWALLSFHGEHRKFLEDQTYHKFKKIGMVDAISRRFWDVTDDDDYIRGYSEMQKKLVLFNREHAKVIVDFVKTMQDMDEEIVLVAHCNAGISRSGALGVFAAEYIGYGFDRLMKENPRLQPNPFVLRLLREEAGLGGKNAFMSKEEAEASSSVSTR
jgi:predicted protein tyrosine phosphatase